MKYEKLMKKKDLSDLIIFYMVKNYTYIFVSIQYTLMSCRFPLPSHTAIHIIIIHLADALNQSNLERPFKEYIYQFVLGIEPMTLA